MPFAALLIGGIIVIVALNGTHRDLAAELESDLPGFFKWAVAIVAILGLGFLPGLKTPSRLLLALVVIVIVLTNYQQIVNGIKSFAAGSGAPSSTPLSAGGGDGAAAATPTPPLSLLNDFSPVDFLAAFGGAVA